MFEKKNLDYFNYASVDFLIDKNGIPVFMEVNDNTLAPYYIEQKNLIAQQALVGKSELINLNVHHKEALVSCFDKYFDIGYENILHGRKRIAIICKRRDHPEGIEKEIKYLIQLFQHHGYDAEMYTPEDCEVKQEFIYIKKNNSRPSVIFRRNFSFPPTGIIQPVINDVIVREITGNKYRTHDIVSHLIDKGKVDIRQPETYLVKDQITLLDTIEMFNQKKRDCIAKPNHSYGGDGFFCFKKNESIMKLESSKKIEIITRRMAVGEEYLIQEKIESALFKSVDNQNYCFDVRVMIYGGQFAGIEGRRSNHPFNKRSSNDKSLVTNINSGGVDILVLSTLNKSCFYESRPLLSKDNMNFINFELDSNVLILGDEIYSKVKQASEAIVQTIDDAISNREVYEHA